MKKNNKIRTISSLLHNSFKTDAFASEISGEDFGVLLVVMETFLSQIFIAYVRHQI